MLLDRVESTDRVQRLFNYAMSYQQRRSCWVRVTGTKRA